MSATLRFIAQGVKRVLPTRVRITSSGNNFRTLSDDESERGKHYALIVKVDVGIDSIQSCVVGMETQ